jgi:hypothetical protein
MTIVNVLRILPDGSEQFERHSQLRDCFPDNEDDYHRAIDEIKLAGRVWVGGGAAPLFLLIRTNSEI